MNSATPSAAAPPSFDPQLIRKYDDFGPRYTSYPTADRFDERFGAADYVGALQLRNETRAAQPLSLYVHLPFCNTICYYCACNKIITRNREHSARYVSSLEREIAIVGALVEGDPPVSQLHWGGGTPTFLARDEMRALMHALRRNFRFAPTRRSRSRSTRARSTKRPLRSSRSSGSTACRSASRTSIPTCSGR
jgi:oxygen-independent coproporphyrinogen-3 oxidase